MRTPSQFVARDYEDAGHSQRLVRKFCANKMIGAAPMDFSAA
jgi:hypothetical protein